MRVAAVMAVLVATGAQAQELDFKDRWVLRERAAVSRSNEAKPETKPVAKPAAPIEHNVCTRHGMRKVVTRGGRSWRCRK